MRTFYSVFFLLLLSSFTKCLNMSISNAKKVGIIRNQFFQANWALSNYWAKGKLLHNESEKNFGE